MDGQTLTQLAILGILLGLSGFFSASETALLSSNKIRIRHLADEGNPLARLAPPPTASRSIWRR